MKRLAVITLAVLLCAGSASAMYLSRGVPAVAAVCTLLAQNGSPCTNAYSMTRQLVQGYAGPLFQVKNTSSSATCNIPQTPNGSANYAGCIAFACAGTASNCNVVQIYDQVNSANNLQLYTSSAPTLTIDSATGLPWLYNTGGAQFFITSDPGSHDQSSDTAATGAPAVGAARSVAMVGQANNNSSVCCGSFGWAHSAATPIGGSGYYGGDMLIGTGYGVNTLYGYGTAGNYNVVMDLEQGGACSGGPANFTISTSQTDELLIATWDGASVMAGSNNGHAWTGNTSGPASGCTDQGQYVHLAAGGDMSSAPLIFREGVLTSGAMNSTAQAAYLSNVQAFYSTLAFN